jgi:predicted small integral membrane protein
MPLLAILLTVLFVGLKLAGFIAWSWVAVVSPLLIWAAIIAAVFAIAILSFAFGLAKS